MRIEPPYNALLNRAVSNATSSSVSSNDQVSRYDPQHLNQPFPFCVSIPTAVNSGANANALSHYTERKKCGPRSGQKAKCARAPSATLPLTEEQKLRAHSRHPTDDSATRASHAAPALGESIYSGLRLGSSLPPSHGPPSLAAGDLSGETTGVDFTDYSDAPPSHHMLVRDESGGSWWSLEDQVKAPESASCPAWAHQEAGYGRSGTSCHPNHDVGHVDDGHLRKKCRYESGGRWEDAHEATGGGGSVSGASGGSGCETSEDDVSVESGQAEEEVAALLIHLWRSEPLVEELSGEPLIKDARSSPAVVRRTAHASRHGNSNRR